MEKYGFIYIWFDKKRKMYYIGSHWGVENDGYICSSNRMRDAYRRRPNDFKRRIISKINDRKILLDEEHKWLSFIKDEELGKKYYNLRKHKWGHWTTDENKRMSIGEKISMSHRANPNWGLWNKGKKIHSEEAKQKLREANKKQFENEEQREIRRIKTKELWSDPIYREKTSNSHKGKKQTEEQINKRLDSFKKNGVLRKVIIEGIEYESISSAMKILNKTVKWVRYHDEISGYKPKRTINNG